MSIKTVTMYGVVCDGCGTLCGEEYCYWDDRSYADDQPGNWSWYTHGDFHLCERCWFKTAVECPECGTLSPVVHQWCVECEEWINRDE